MWKSTRISASTRYSTNDGDSLAHYGVLGMKWGVRRYQNKDGSLTAIGQKRYEHRQTTIKSYKEDIKRNEANKRRASTAINDINKKGINSKHVKDLYKYDSNFQESLTDIEDRGKDLWDNSKGEMRNLSSLTKANKKEIIERAKKYFSYDAKYSSDREKKIIKNIETTPIYKKSYAEVLKQQKHIDRGAAITGAILPIAAAITIGSVAGLPAGKIAGAATKAALLVSPTTAFAGVMNSPSLTKRYYNKHIK